MKHDKKDEEEDEAETTVLGESNQQISESMNSVCGKEQIESDAKKNHASGLQTSSSRVHPDSCWPTNNIVVVVETRKSKWYNHHELSNKLLASRRESVCDHWSTTTSESILAVPHQHHRVNNLLCLNL